ncbi:MAG: transglycosylase family protein [Acidimicrobiales bacterium]
MRLLSSTPADGFLSRRPVLRRCGALLVASAVGAVLMFGPFASADEIEELRDGIPTGAVVRAEISRLSDERDSLLSQLSAAESLLAAELEERDRLDDSQRLLASQIEAAADHLRTVAVRAFVSGGELGELQYLVNVESASELSWRRHLLHNHADSSQLALDRLESLEALASDDVRDSIATADRLRSDIAGLESEIARIDPLIAEELALQPLADAWDRAAIAIEEGRYGIAPEDKWEQLRFCESSDNYQAVSPDGNYRGAYQFDFPTWQTVGGTGDPAAAPPAEQDARARELYARRGHQPWECGHHLR